MANPHARKHDRMSTDPIGEVEETPGNVSRLQGIPRENAEGRREVAPHSGHADPATGIDPTVKLDTDEPSADASTAASTAEGQQSVVEKTKEGIFRFTQEKSKEWTNVLLQKLRGVKNRGVSFDQVPDRMRHTADQVELCIEFLQDMRTRRYQKISWPAALTISAAILYTLSPADLIPEVLPVLGSVDDAVILAIAVSLTKNELKKYCRFKGYDPNRYFPPEDTH